MRVFLSNLGCKLNQAELDHLGRSLRRAGHDLVDSLLEADLHILNTCNVTHLAARDSRKLTRRGKRVNPSLRTVLTGCYATGQPEEAARLAGVDLVVPNPEKERLLERIAARFPEMASATHGSASIPVPYVPMRFGHSRALVKVEDGCNMRCSFCVIPMMRGPQVSRPLPDILAEVRALAEAGHQEVVVTGVQISTYAWGGHGLYELTRALLEETEIPRVRLTSIAPWQFDDRLLDLFASNRLCRHFHLSLQSGCTRTLKRMRRPYTATEFSTLVSEIRLRIPGVAITTDVIVGFPGETPRDFDESLEFCHRVAFARLHAFPFSPRPGTEANEMPDQITHAVKRARMERMLAVAKQSRESFERQHTNTAAAVLWEYKQRGTWYGMTDNYLRVVTETDHELAHRITPVRLTRRGETGLACSLPRATGG
jgi:threonylcarbamoyladenosine tRNA methylthiotransferase MtaB